MLAHRPLYTAHVLKAFRSEPPDVPPPECIQTLLLGLDPTTDVSSVNFTIWQPLCFAEDSYVSRRGSAHSPEGILTYCGSHQEVQDPVAEEGAHPECWQFMDRGLRYIDIKIRCEVHKQQTTCGLEYGQCSIGTTEEMAYSVDWFFQYIYTDVDPQWPWWHS